MNVAVTFNDVKLVLDRQAQETVAVSSHKQSAPLY